MRLSRRAASLKAGFGAPQLLSKRRTRRGGKEGLGRTVLGELVRPRPIQPGWGDRAWTPRSGRNVERGTFMRNVSCKTACCCGSSGGVAPSLRTPEPIVKSISYQHCAGASARGAACAVAAAGEPSGPICLDPVSVPHSLSTRCERDHPQPTAVTIVGGLPSSAHGPGYSTSLIAAPGVASPPLK
jgi:hypothetical protein